MAERNKKSAKQSVSDSKLGGAMRAVERMWKENKPLLGIVIFGSLLISVLLVGLFITSAAHGFNSEYPITLPNIIGNGFRYIPLGLILWPVIAYIFVRIAAMYKKDSHYDAIRDVEVHDSKQLGSATGIRDGQEKDELFEKSNRFETKENIYGRDLEHPNQLLALNRSILGINRYILVLGYPGCGKSRCWVIPNLFQIIRRGESCIVTDTKASIYGLMKMVAEAHGYVTKFINFDAKSMAHSDAVNLFAPATRSDLDCLSFAKAVVDNLGEAHETGYWPKAEMNLLTACMLLVKNDSTREKSLPEVARLLNNNDTNTLMSEFLDKAVEGSVMTGCANNWIHSGDRARDDGRSGLAMDFTRLLDPTISAVISNDEVDLTLPGKQKCMYFVNLSDQDRSLDFLSALFFQELISELENVADKNKKQCLDVPVTLLFEEFANIGRLPNWSETMNTIRSRGITPIMILQCLEQLAKNYPTDAKAIQGACATQVLLGTNLEETATYFSRRSGKQTVTTGSTSTKKNVGDPLNVRETVNISEGMSARDLYTLDEIYRIRSPRELVVVSGFNVCEMERVDMSLHPMMAEVRKIDARCHFPEWVKRLDPAEYPAYGIDIREFKTDEQMLRESGFDPDEKPYICSEADFKKFYDGKKKIMVDDNDEEERKILAFLRRRKEEELVPEGMKADYGTEDNNDLMSTFSAKSQSPVKKKPIQEQPKEQNPTAGQKPKRQPLSKDKDTDIFG